MPLAAAILCLPFLASLLTPLVGRGRRLRTTWMMAGTAAACLALTLALWPAISGGDAVRHALPWMPALGLEFIIRVDGLAWLFMVLASGIGLLVAIYAHYYMPREFPLVRFFSLLLAFMGSMLGIVMAGNLIQLLFFWELTSLLSFLLIGYWHQGESARDAARISLIVTGGGGLCLLAGLLLLGYIAGSFDLDVVLASGARIRSSGLYLPTLTLIAIGALAKSAQFPFHFWLPQAMSAPTPVSAYLHSATMVKAGVFLLLRLWPVLAGTEAWFWMIGGAGLISLLLGAWAATLQQDLKAVLAYSTVSHLGLITMLLGFGNTLGAVAAIFHIVNHATFKASLFMAAGAVDTETGTRDLRRLGGLRHVMPITTALALVSGAAMAGVPLLNGFLSKEMFFAAALGLQHGLVVDVLTAALAVLAAALGVLYSLRLLLGAFFGPLQHEAPRPPREPPRWMRFPIGFLALACLAVGILPAWSIGPALGAAARSVLGLHVPSYSLSIWHGWTAPLAMSFVAFAIGCGLYLAWRRRLGERPAGPLLTRLSAQQSFERLLVAATTTLPELQRRIFPARRLQVQLLMLVLLAGAVIAVTMPRGGAGTGTSPVDPAFAGLWLLGAACALGAAVQAKFHRLAALVFSGGAGLVVCITFAWLAAPDLALTQLLVEAVTTILILLGLRWLPRRIAGLARSSRRARWRRRRDLVLAAGSGAGLALLAWTTMRVEVPDAAAAFFLREALPGGGGRNVVNVILVDFRGFDTLGEITVLGIVAVSIFALLRRFRPAPESIPKPKQQLLIQVAQPAVAEPAADGEVRVPDYLAVPGHMLVAIAPLVALFGAHLFLRGHNLPGGGFVAGLAMTVALIALYMARGARWVEAHLRVVPLRWIGAGLLTALATGAGAMLAQRPFLTSAHGTLHLPLLGELPLASALTFDLGVFAVVVGASTLILIALAHQALRRPATPPPEEAG